MSCLNLTLNWVRHRIELAYVVLLVAMAQNDILKVLDKLDVVYEWSIDDWQLTQSTTRSHSSSGANCPSFQ